MEDLINDFHSNGEAGTSAAKRQSVRTKFKLSREAVAAKEFIAEHFGISQKEAADVAVSNFNSFLGSLDEEEMRRLAHKTRSHGREKVRKTHVVSRKTKERLEFLMEKLDASRDEVFEQVLRFMRSLIELQQQNQIDQHKKLLPAIQELEQKAGEVEALAHGELSKDDPLRREIGAICLILENMLSDVRDEVQNNRPLPNDHAFF
jgi:hypothetical protein